MYLSPDILEGLQRLIQIIEKGMPRAKQQLAQSEQELANITGRHGWENLSKTAKNRAMREAKVRVGGDKKSLTSAQTTLANLKWLVRGL